MRTLVIIIAASTVTLGGGYYGYQAVSGGSQAQRYKTATVDRGTLVSTVTAIGTVEPILRVVVGSQVSGTVMRWHADFNQTVKQNEVLAELDQDQIKATIAQRTAALAAQGVNGPAIDVSSGTGDLALELAKRPEVRHAVGLDLLSNMVSRARSKILARGMSGSVTMMTGDALSLPFADGSFACATAGFSLRNMPDVEKALSEMV